MTALGSELAVTPSEEGGGSEEQQEKHTGGQPTRAPSVDQTPFSRKASLNFSKTNSIYTNSLQKINSVMREQGSRSLTRLTVKSFFIEFKFHGPLEVWRQNSQGRFWTNECFANCFSNRFVVLFLRLGRTFGFCNLALHLKNNSKYFN